MVMKQIHRHLQFIDNKICKLIQIWMTKPDGFYSAHIIHCIRNGLKCNNSECWYECDTGHRGPSPALLRHVTRVHCRRDGQQEVPLTNTDMQLRLWTCQPTLSTHLNMATVMNFNYMNSNPFKCVCFKNELTAEKKWCYCKTCHVLVNVRIGRNS